ncbi:MAG: hypothetical protein Q4C58_13160 [Eubacteriales bacterium]|nr:hypothetical protein [Eubacteriales bacterium]
MNRNNIIKIIVFILLVSCIGSSVFRALNYKSTGGGGGWQRFYAQKEDSIDVMFFGSSHAHCTVDLGYLWDNYGMAGYTLSAGSQMIDGTYYFVKEALKTQNPKVIVVEMMGTTGNELADNAAVVYRNTMGMKWSADLREFVHYLAGNLNKDETWEQEIFAKIPIIHSRYAELEQADFEDPIPFMKGYRGSFECISFDYPAGADTQEVLELNQEKLEWLQKIIALAKEKDVQLVLFASPYSVPEERQMQFNRIAEIAAQNNVPFINFNHLYDEIGIDFAADMRDSDHVNNAGAVKVTEYLAQYLKDNYEIPDRRSEKGYEQWEQNALYLRNKALRYELENAADINEYLQKLTDLKDEQLVILALTGNYNALGEVYLEKLSLLGITAGEYYEGGVWILRDGKTAVRLSGENYSQYYQVQNGEIYLGSRLSVNEDGDSYEEVRLVINGKDYRLVENGVNIVVYNEAIDQVIDAAGDDIYLGLELIHNEKSDE